MFLKLLFFVFIVNLLLFIRLFHDRLSTKFGKIQVTDTVQTVGKKVHKLHLKSKASFLVKLECDAGTVERLIKSQKGRGSTEI